MTAILSVLVAAALFVAFGWLAQRNRSRSPGCGGCPLQEYGAECGASTEERKGEKVCDIHRGRIKS